MSVFSGPVQKERVYPLIEKGEYVATLLDLTFEEGGTYGDSLLWKWLVAHPEDPTAYLCRDDGNEKTIHEYTSPDIILGSKPHEWIGALTGKVLEDGEEPPDSDDLVGKRMLVYLTHLAPKKGPNAGKLRERLAEGSAKRWGGPPKTIARPTHAPVSDGRADEEIDRSLLVSKLQKQVARAVKLGTPTSASMAEAMTPDAIEEATTEALQHASDLLGEEIKAALED